MLKICRLWVIVINITYSELLILQSLRRVNAVAELRQRHSLQDAAGLGFLADTEENVG